MSRRRQLGDATLALLADECMLAVLNVLSDGPASAREIEDRAPGISHQTASRCLRALARGRFASAVHEAQGSSREDGRQGRPRVRYELSELGRELLLEVVRAAVDSERAWRPPLAPRGAPGLWVLKLLSDRRARALARELADAPLTPAELEARLPQLASSTFKARLKTLRDYGVLVREKHDGETRYALPQDARRMAIVVLLAARCEWRRADPEDRTLGGDMPGLLHVLAPLARVPRATTGSCRWRVDAHGTPAPEVHLTAAAGRVAALGASPLTEPDAAGHAVLEVWCEALLSGDPSEIATTGEEALFRAIFGALSVALSQ